MRRSPLRRPRQRRAAGRGSRARRGAADLRQRRPRLGGGRARDGRRAARRARRCAAARARSSRSSSTCATSTRPRTGRSRARPPAYHTPDEDVYLPGRNIVLLGKAGVYCAAAQVDRLVLGTLDHNPFPDATPEFRGAMARALSLGLRTPLEIDAPYARRARPKSSAAARRSACRSSSRCRA